jgi:hypothetical protein
MVGIAKHENDDQVLEGCQKGMPGRSQGCIETPLWDVQKCDDSILDVDT